MLWCIPCEQAHETEREEIRNKNLEDINMLRINLENKIEDLERQFDEVWSPSGYALLCLAFVCFGFVCFDCSFLFCNMCVEMFLRL